MSKYYESDEEYYSDEYEEVEECERDIIKDRSDDQYSDEFIPADENLETKRADPRKRKRKGGFDVDEFDMKVATSIRKIHRDVEINVKFHQWIKKNFYHLNNMYRLSNLNCDVSIFYRYVYDHSK